MKFANILTFIAVSLSYGNAADMEYSEEDKSVCFHRMCGSNPMGNPMRGFDKFGAGFYGAPRGLPTTHKGVDIVCFKNTDVYAPFKAVIVREERPFDTDKHKTNNGLVLRGASPDTKHWELKIWYVIALPEIVGKTVNGGDLIGYHPSIHDYPDFGPQMTDHIHVELYNRGKVVNPMKYLCIRNYLKKAFEDEL